MRKANDGTDSIYKTLLHIAKIYSRANTQRLLHSVGADRQQKGELNAAHTFDSNFVALFHFNIDEAMPLGKTC